MISAIEITTWSRESQAADRLRSYRDRAEADDRLALRTVAGYMVLVRSGMHPRAALAMAERHAVRTLAREATA